VSLDVQRLELWTLTTNVKQGLYDIGSNSTKSEGTL